MDLSPMVQAMIVYMRDHYPTNPEELNFHAELKAASQWGWSNDYNQLVMKKVPLNDCRLKIAATETLKTWKKEKADLQTRKTEDSDSSHENVDEQLSGGVLEPMNKAYYPHLSLFSLIVFMSLVQNALAIPS